jgi:hypothetical protein
VSLCLSLAVSATSCGIAQIPTQCGAAERICLPECHCSRAELRKECQADSAAFVVRSFVGGPRAGDVAQHCEDACSRLREDVFNFSSEVRWQPRCRVVLHASRSSYLAAVGRNGSQTIGSSTISLSGGRVTQRRIDLLAIDAEKGLAALPHELVHVLFVDAFPTAAPPKWAEEGLALVMDPADKRARHERDLDVALRSRATLPISRMLADANYPETSYRAAFYGQSLSLVEYLMQQAPPSEFVRFAKLATERGTERALADVYQLNPRTLERNWRAYVTATPLAVAR